MTASTIIIDYLGQGLSSARPATPNVPAGGTAIYAETDTGNAYAWVGGAWLLIAGPTISGMSQLTGDVTAGPGGGSQAATIAGHAVTNGKLAQAPLYTLKGNNTAGTADVADLTINQVKTLLGVGFRTQAAISNYTITIPADNGLHFNNIGAAGDIVLTLPAAGNGLQFGFTVNAGHYLKIQAVGSDVITLGERASASGGFVRSNVPQSYLILSSHRTGAWSATVIAGAWDIDGGTAAHGAFTAGALTSGHFAKFDGSGNLVDGGAGTGGGSGSTAVATVGDTFPASPVSGQLHWLSTDGQLYVFYGTAWVIANTAPSALPPGTSANDNLIFDGSVWGAQRPRYGVAFSFVGGVLPASQLLGIHCFTKAVSFNSNWTGYLGHNPEAGGTANATASTVIAVEKALAASPNTWSGVGTITIAAGGIVPTFATSGGAAVSFSVADRMRMVGPATPDTTFANFYASLVGRET